MSTTYREYGAGDIVRHGSEFLHNIGWFTDVPVNGLVRSTSTFAEGKQVLRVEWSDGAENSILACNVEPCPRAAAEARRPHMPGTARVNCKGSEPRHWLPGTPRPHRVGG